MEDEKPPSIQPPKRNNILDKISNWLNRSHGKETETSASVVETEHTTTKINTLKTGAVVKANEGTAVAYIDASTYESEIKVEKKTKDQRFGISLAGAVRKDHANATAGVENFTAKVGVGYSTNEVEGKLTVTLFGVSVEVSAGVGIGAGAGAEIGITGASAEAGILVKASVGIKIIQIRPGDQ